jgi:hypothetical protein
VKQGTTESCDKPRKKHHYEVVECEECGKRVHDNWYIRHVRSCCKLGVLIESEMQPED